MRTLCLDFDGVIHSYVSGWQKPDVIPDPPVPGATQFIMRALEHFRVVIFSSRTGQPGGLDAMQRYLYEHLLADYGSAGEVAFHRLEWPTDKPSAFVTLDDRAITFTGEWPDMQTILDFKPWNHNEKQPRKTT